MTTCSKEKHYTRCQGRIAGGFKLRSHEDDVCESKQRGINHSINLSPTVQMFPGT